MAGISTGAHGGPRASNHDIPLVPFIDFLLCLVMFLLVTAVWSNMARLEADAQVPGAAEPAGKDDKTLELHVDMTPSRKFLLKWQQGPTVINTLEVERTAVTSGDSISYPALQKAIHEQWQSMSPLHKSPSDPLRDRAVLHTDNSTAFEQIAAALDAIASVNRPLLQRGANATMASQEVTIPAFQVAFAAN